MNAIDLVVRSDAGTIERDVLAGSADTTMLQMTSGDEISLNLSQGDVQRYLRDGDNLVITLADGRTLVLQDYFAEASEAPKLYLSSDGLLQEVFFVEADGGVLYAEYSQVAEWGKWSPDEALIHYERAELVGPEGNDVSMLAAGLLGGMGLLGPAAAGAAALGAAAIAGGGDSGGGSGGGGDGGTQAGETWVRPSVDGPALVIAGDDAEERFAITGRGMAGDRVEVTIGHERVDTTVADDGTWQATFVGESFPVDGVYEAVVAVQTSRGQIDLAGPHVTIDLTGPALTISEGTVEVGDLLNKAGHADGLRIAGTGEAGTQVEVTVSGQSQSATVAEDGHWSVTFTPEQIETGTYITDVTVTSRDVYGNSSRLAQTVQVDTSVSVAIGEIVIGGDDVVNGDEQEAGVTLTGTADAGAGVVVTIGNVVYPEIIADTDGSWALDIPGGALPTGETDVEVSATATDGAGNSSSTSATLQIDTLVDPLRLTEIPGGADGIINAAEAAAGVTFVGEVEAGAALIVQIGSVAHAATVAADGRWEVTFASGELPAGDLQSAEVLLNATDAAGNSRSERAQISIDTDGGYLTIDPAPIEGDDVVNKLEASDGVTILGTATPDMLVTVTLGGVEAIVRSDAAGQWSVSYAAEDIPPDTDLAAITATITDPVGNGLSAADGVAIDTIVENQGIDASDFGGDAVVNAEDAVAGVEITGTTEIGAHAVRVTIGDVTVSADVDAAAGTWRVTMPEAAFRASDEYSVDVVVESTDAAGNVDSISQSIAVDTWVNDLSADASAATPDGIVSAADLSASGLALSGTVEPGARLDVMFNSHSYTARVAADGGWQLTIPSADVPRGEYDAQISLAATDAAGNTRSAEQILAIDTVAPEGPQVAFVLEAPAGVAGVFLGAQDETQAVYELSPDGGIDAVAHAPASDLGPQTAYNFDETVPDGSHLVVTAADEAGNTRGTFLVLEDGAVGGEVSLGHAGLGAMNIDTIQMEFAEDGALTLTEADILALSSDSDSVRITGGSDDRVTIAGATRGAQVSDGPESYTEYTLGEATILVDEDITNVVT